MKKTKGVGASAEGVRQSNVSKETMRIIYPPAPSHNATNAVQFVRLKLGEEVRWIWQHSPSGTFVTGYEIIRHGKDS